MTKKLFGLCLCALAITSLFLVSCDKDEEVYVNAPSLSVSVATISAEYGGGSYSFSYSVTNPLDGGAISYSAGASWITNLSDTGGVISFSVSANKGEWRTGTIEVHYSSSFGYVSKTVTVVQNSSTSPQLVVQPTGVTAPIYGGTCSFTYEVINPAADGAIQCRTAAEWINYFSYSNGSVSFIVDENTTTTLRQGVITVEYISSEYALSETVTVYQDHSGVDDDSFVIDFSSVIGTYEAEGDAYLESSTSSHQKWTLTIYEYSNTQVLIDGLTPQTEGYYPANDGFTAKATLNAYSQLVVPFQTNDYTISGYFVGWMPCTDFAAGKGWARASDGSVLDLTFTYDASTDLWTSDYGEFLGIFSVANSYKSWQGFYDVVNPVFTIKKISSETNSASTKGLSHPLGEGLLIHTECYSK